MDSLGYFHSSLTDDDLLNDDNRREELLKMMLHTLDQMGYKKTAQKLSEESKVQIESDPLVHAENGILSGDWQEVQKFLEGLNIEKEQIRNICFLINEQKYIELIVNQQYNDALILLRGELVQGSEDSDKLSKLASILMCSSVQDIEEKLNTKIDISKSREKLVKEIKKELGVNELLDKSRFNKLLQQAICFQFSKCKYHERKDQDQHENPGLMEDHLCGIEEFPSKAYLGFREQSDDICIVKFSNKGELVATVTSSKELRVWELKIQCMTPKLKFKISKIHERSVQCINWSPNDKKILTASSDKKVKIWDAETGALKVILDGHQESIRAATWIPGSQNFISGGLDNYMILWNNHGEEVARVNACKVIELLASCDGRRLYLISASHPKIIVVDTISQTEIDWMPESGIVSAATLSQDSKFLLTQLPHPISELHLWDLEKHKIIQVYPTQAKESRRLGFSFGGTENQFIACGGEQGEIRIWHRNHTEPVMVLKGHSLTVNSISWHPSSPHLLISASEDRTTCIWVSEHLHAVLKNGEAYELRNSMDVKENEKMYEEKLYEFEESNA